MKNTTNNQEKKVFNLQDAINNLLAEDDASIRRKSRQSLLMRHGAMTSPMKARAAPCWRHI